MLVATVEHSGTMQLLKILDHEVRPLSEGAAGVMFDHLYDASMPAILAFDGLILTTRRPEPDIRASWQRRGKDQHELDRQLVNYRRLLELKPYVMELGRCR